MHQQQLMREAAMYRPDEGGRARLVLLGDSITEAFRGTAIGEVVQRTKGQSAILQQTLALDFPSPLVLAISADETQHLLWRISNGALETGVDTMFMVAIGTNNIGHDPPADVALGIQAIIGVIRDRRPDCPILLSPPTL